MTKKQKPGDRTAETLLAKLNHLENKYRDGDYPRVSVIMPTYNCSQLVDLTLDSILNQNHPFFEVIVVDAGSTDRTLDVVRSYQDPRLHIFEVGKCQRYEMINKGIEASKGAYINILFPGDFYLAHNALKYMMALALEHQTPDLVFSGTLLRDGKSEVKVLFRPLSIELLKQGQQPTSLQSCWFRADIFQKLGLFNTSYSLRGCFELLCRFSMHAELKAVSARRILTDYDLRWVTWRMIVRHFWESLRTIYHYFGLFSALRWLCRQKDIARFFRFWFRSLKVGLTKR